MAYPSPSTINASKGFGEIMVYVNNVTNFWLSNMILIGIWIIVLMGFYKSQDDFAGGLAVAGYVTFVIGIFFWLGGAISPLAFGITVAMAIIGTVILMIDQS